jgi:hypothetical protein
MDAAAMVETTSRLRNVCHLRRRSGRQKKSSDASVAPPPKANICLIGLWSAAVDPAVVLTVSVAVTAVPAMAAGAVAEQVGASTESDGLAVTAHVSVTMPVNPPLGVMVMIEVPVAPGDAMLIGPLLIVKVVASTGATTVIATLIDSAKVPELPVTVAV